MRNKQNPVPKTAGESGAFFSPVLLDLLVEMNQQTLSTEYNINVVKFSMKDKQHFLTFLEKTNIRERADGEQLIDCYSCLFPGGSALILCLFL